MAKVWARTREILGDKNFAELIRTADEAGESVFDMSEAYDACNAFKLTAPFLRGLSRSGPYSSTNVAC